MKKQPFLSKQNFAKAEKALIAAGGLRSVGLGSPCAQPSTPDFIICDDLVPCTKDVTATEIEKRYRELAATYWPASATKQPGIKPMAYNNSPTTAAVSLSVETTKSESQTQREYILSRLEGLKSRWDVFPDELRQKMRKLFNLDARTYPAKPQDLVAAITAGKFTLDQKKIDKVNAMQAEYEASHSEDVDPDYYWDDYSTLGFITFTDLPKADRKGYDAAMTAYTDDWQKVKDLTMTGNIADAMAAVQALENWTPPSKAS